MVNFLQKLFGKTFANKTVLFGKGSAGKTAIVNRITKNIFVATTPTTGKNMKVIKWGDSKIYIHDIGGQDKYKDERKLEIYKNTKIIILTVDSTDKSMILPLKEELQTYIEHINSHNIKILVAFTKVDLLLNSLDKMKEKDKIIDKVEMEFTEGLGLRSLNSYLVTFTSSKSDFGIADFILKLNSLIEDSIHDRSNVRLIDFQLFDEKNIPLRHLASPYFNSEEFKEELDNFSKSNDRALHIDGGDIALCFKKSEHYLLCGIVKKGDMDIGFILLDELDQFIVKIEDKELIPLYVEHFSTNIKRSDSRG